MPEHRNARPHRRFTLARMRGFRGLPIEVAIGRIFVSGLMALTILLVVLDAIGARTIEPWRSPQDELRLNPLAAEMKDRTCQVYDDANGTVHLLASSDLDAMACLGYAHARDRAWQMDFFRRIARGRSAEVFGWRSLRSDFIMNLLELERHARRIFSEMEPEQRRVLWAYAYGVNQALVEVERSGRVPEFRKLRIKVRGWQPVDTVSLILLQSFDQTRKGFETDLSEMERLAGLGPDVERLNRNDGMPWDVSVLKSGEYPMRRSRGGGSQRRQDAEESSTALIAPPLPSDPASAEHQGASQSQSHSLLKRASAGEGSNNWVLAPQRSLRGRAWLANDPHLALTRPGFWHWIHVKGIELDVIGASFPGIPLIVSGANQKVAWGLTNSYLDAADVVRVPESTAMAEGEWHRPWIPVRVGSARIPFFFLRFLKLADRFPVLPMGDGGEGSVLALRWSGFSLTGQDLGAMFDLMQVQSSHEADEALSRVGVPSWNFVFADVKGDIGYRAVGKTPRRFAPAPIGAQDPAQDGSIGWAGTHPWLTPDEMPHAFNPRRGFIVTANNRQWPTDAALAGGRAYAQGFRAFRIEELLNATPRHGLQSIQKVQCDVQSVDLRFLIPALLEVVEPEGLSDSLEARSPADAQFSDAIRRLGDWASHREFAATLDCRECGVARRWLERLQEKTLLDAPGNYRWAEIAREHPLDEPSRHFRGWAINSLKEALSDLSPNPWRPWGELHRNFFPALQAAVDAVPGSGFPLATPGDEHSVNPGTSDWNESERRYRQTHGASQRLIVELTDPPSVHVQLAGENRPLDPAWEGNTAWERWRDCAISSQIFPLDFGSAQVVQQLKTVLFE